MRRFISYVVVFFGILIGLFGYSAEVSAEDTDAWLTKEIIKVSEVSSSAFTEDEKTCAGRIGVIEVVDTARYKDACIFGSTQTLRVARYRGANDLFLYAVAFPTDTAYLPVRGLCEGLARCMYGQAGDSLLLQTEVTPGKFTYALIKDFKKYLTRYSDSSRYYQFEYSGEYTYLRAGNTYVSTASAKVSANGRWAVVELPEYGFIRIDLKNLSYTRVAAHDSLPPHALLVLEPAISDDGRWMAVAGYGMGIFIYEVINSCGDSLTETSNQYFQTETIVCNSVLVQASDLFINFSEAHVPKFSIDSRRIQIEVKASGRYFTATLAPQFESLGNPKYVAFGDSFTSGEGEVSDNFYLPATNTGTNRCHVSSRSYPYLLGNSWEIVTSNLACSGSRIEGVQNANRNLVTDATQERPTIISLGIGGNDVDFMGKLKSCIGTETCDWAKLGKRGSTAREIKGLFSRVVDIISELKTNFPSTFLFVVGYPNVINEQSSASCSPLVSALLDADERRYMSESISYINKVLRAASDYSKVTFVDIEQAYQGERLCDSKETAMNALRYGGDIAPIPMLGDLKFIGVESFHPTPRGHQLAASTINTKLQSFWSSPACTTCGFSESELALTTYWTEGEGFNESAYRQLADVFLETETWVRMSTAKYNFLPDTFAPGSAVRFELHSQVHELSKAIANDDGSLTGEFVIPNKVTGYHTVHALGQSYSGELLDIYQTVFIDSQSVNEDESSSEAVVTLSSVDKSDGSAVAPANSVDSYKEPHSVQSSKAILGATTSDPRTTVRNKVNEDEAQESKLFAWWPVGLGIVSLLLLFLWLLLSHLKTKRIQRSGDR